MRISMKCSIAVHCLIFIYEAQGVAKVTSGLLAESTGCNPVTIRGIMSDLKKAGIIASPRGTGGAELIEDPSHFTLLRIYSALEPTGMGDLIGIHSCQGRACPVAKSIRSVLKPPYEAIEEAISQTMAGITLRSMIDDFERMQAGRELPGERRLAQLGPDELNRSPGEKTGHNDAGDSFKGTSTLQHRDIRSYPHS